MAFTWTYLDGFGCQELWEFTNNTIARPRYVDYPDTTECGPQLSVIEATWAPSGPIPIEMRDALDATLSDFHQHRNEVLLWLHHEACIGDDYDLGSSTSSDSDDVEQVIVPWDFDQEEEVVLSNFVYLWRRENGIEDVWQLTFDNDSSSPDLESTAGLDSFIFYECPEYFTPVYAKQLQRLHDLNTAATSGAADASRSSRPESATAASPTAGATTSPDLATAPFSAAPTSPPTTSSALLATAALTDNNDTHTN